MLCIGRRRLESIMLGDRQDAPELCVRAIDWARRRVALCVSQPGVYGNWAILCERESFRLDEQQVLVTFIGLDEQYNRVRLGFDAPPSLRIDRKEIWLRKSRTSGQGSPLGGPGTAEPRPVL